jgi:hypothetical protein
MKPTDRNTFKQFCLRRLGAPTFKINLTENQIDDCVDQALFLFAQYHMDGSEKTYYKYQITDVDIANKYITLPENILGVVKIFPVGSALGTNSLFNMRYQFIYNDLYNFANVSLVPYYMAMTHIAQIQEMLVGEKPFRFNRYNNILHLDMDLEVIVAGQFILLEAYQVVDPTQYQLCWTDKWLQDYCTALIKKEWGLVLSIYDLPMPGAMKINGQMLKDDGQKDLERLEADLYKNYAIPAAMLWQ